MPKQKITKEMVVNAAFQLAREGGMEQVLVKNIAARLGCSVQPIYSYCQNMDGLRTAVYAKVREFARGWFAQEKCSPGSFQAVGRACVRLAQEEPELFKLFALRRREGVSSLEELRQKEASPKVAQAIAAQLGLSMEQARRLHLDMLIYTVGLGTIFSVTMPGIPAQEVFARQERAYQAFLKQAKEEPGHEE